MTFQIGDEVEVTNSKYKGLRGKITYIPPIRGWVDISVNEGSPFDINELSYLPASEFILTPKENDMEFNPGDVVEVANPPGTLSRFKGMQGIVLKQWGGPASGVLIEIEESLESYYIAHWKTFKPHELSLVIPCPETDLTVEQAQELVDRAWKGLEAAQEMLAKARKANRIPPEPEVGSTIIYNYTTLQFGGREFRDSATHDPAENAWYNVGEEEAYTWEQIIEDIRNETSWVSDITVIPGSDVSRTYYITLTEDSYTVSTNDEMRKR